MSGFQGAWLNVAVNLDSVTDETFVDSTVRTVRDRLEASGVAIAAIWQAPPLHDLLARATALGRESSRSARLYSADGPTEYRRTAAAASRFLRARSR